MNIAEKDKLINKNVDKAAKRMLRITVSTSAVFVVAYQFVLLRWEAPCKEVFNLGVLCNTIALSIVTAYIFYYITTVIPQKQKLKAMKPVVEQSKLDLAASLKMLFNLLTKDEQWSDLDNDTLKANFNASSKERRIWLEECSGIFKTPEVFLLYNPYTLTVISYILTDIQREIDSILQNSQFFDSEYLTRIIWTINTDTYKKLFRLKMSAQEQCNINRDTPKIKSGENYLDSFFCNELPIILFSEENGRIFIDEIKALVTHG